MTSVVTAEELRQLDAAFRRSPREANVALDALLAAHPEQSCRIQRSLRRVYLSRAKHQRLSQGDAAVDELRALLHTAGAMSAKRRPSDEHAVSLPGLPHLRLTGYARLLDDEADSVRSPIEQVQACLIVLTDIHPAVTSPVRKLARQRLVELLLDHPILLHERFVWTIRVRIFVTVPLLHALTLAPSAALPPPLFDIDPARLREFALRPMLPHAARAKAPRLSMSRVGRAFQGRSFLSQVHSKTWPLRRLGYALLCLDRIRAQAQASPALCVSTSEGVAAMLAMAGRTLFACWDRPEFHDGAEEFVAELRATASLPPAALRDLVLAHASSIFVVTADRRLAKVAAPDTLERYESLCQLLMDMGVAESPGAAARLIVARIFASTRPTGLPAAATDHASVEIATKFVNRWRRDGIQDSELLDRARLAAPAWGGVRNSVCEAVY